MSAQHLGIKFSRINSGSKGEKKDQSKILNSFPVSHLGVKIPTLFQGVCLEVNETQLYHMIASHIRGLIQ